MPRGWIAVRLGMLCHSADPCLQHCWEGLHLCRADRLPLQWVGRLRVWGSAALPRLLPPRQAGLRLLPRLWLVLVGALRVPVTQVTASTDAEAEQSVSAACCTLVTRREQDWSQNAVACAGMHIGSVWPAVRRAGTELRGLLTNWCKKHADKLVHPGGHPCIAGELTDPPPLTTAYMRTTAVRKVSAEQFKTAGACNNGEVPPKVCCCSACRNACTRQPGPCVQRGAHWHDRDTRARPAQAAATAMQALLLQDSSKSAPDTLAMPPQQRR